MSNKKIKEGNLKEELKKSKELGEKIVKVPLISNMRIVNGEIVYDIKTYIDTPQHWTFDDDSIVH